MSARQILETVETDNIINRVREAQLALERLEQRAAGIPLLTTLQYPYYWVGWWADAVTAATWVLHPTEFVNQRFRDSYYNSSSADGQTFTFYPFVASGTYSIIHLGISSNNHGRFDMTLDGTSIATAVDWYSAGITYNVDKTTTGVTVASGGLHTLVCTINGKHASSSNYFLNMTRVMMIRTGD